MASAGDIGATKNKLTSTLIPRLHINPDFTVKFSKGLRDRCMLSQRKQQRFNIKPAIGAV